MITEDELKEFIEKNYGTYDKMIKAVTVKLIDLSWFLNYDMKFLTLTKILNQSENQAIFVSEFVMQVLDQFWEQNFKKLLKRQFIPFTICLLTTIFYLQYALKRGESEQERVEKMVHKLIFGSFTIANLANQIYNEIV